MEEIVFRVDNLWIIIAACMVFVMHLGFTALESGMARAKNTVNILFKNFGILSCSILVYALIGFSLMYPGENPMSSFFGFAGFGLSLPENGLTAGYADYTFWSDFVFQAMFAATAATIVSGAIVERMKLISFLTFGVLLVGIAYPIVGMWQWGGGFLSQNGFYDFAGSTIVHSVGGWAALWAAFFIGPRIGRYIDGKPVKILPHSFALATVGVILLWFGWFGFNGGSVLSADPGALSLVITTTLLAGAAGSAVGMIVSGLRYKKADLTNMLNGTLAGLVGITAGADLMSPMEAVIIGSIAGIIVVFSAEFFERSKIDDPVGAISVHLICGIWGTLAVGIFGAKAGLGQLFTQFVGIFTVGVFISIFSFAVLKVIDVFYGLRVSKEDEITGLDTSEHQEKSYMYSLENIRK
tara:strand:- start:2701 stop:3930 length:1230 start_codon:yes stop_codon:yes gene_type:complete